MILSHPEFLLCLVFLPDYEPQTICEHLQYLFALLQNSKRRYIDPSAFVKALGLDTGQQQVCVGGDSWHLQKLGITPGCSLGSSRLGLAADMKGEVGLWAPGRVQGETGGDQDIRSAQGSTQGVMG